jgi:hypothetical protein
MWRRRAGSSGQRQSTARAGWRAVVARAGSGGSDSVRGWRPRGTDVREAVGSGGRWLGRAGGQRQRGPAAVVMAVHEGGLHMASGKRWPTARAHSGLLCVVRATDKECDFG